MANNSHPIEYQMTKKMFDSIAGTRKDKKKNAHDYVAAYLNDTFSLRGTVTSVKITL